MPRHFTVYLISMLCTVYRLRHQGAKLSPDEIKASALIGTLCKTKHGPVGQPVKTATLKDGTGRDILPELTCAAVATVDRGGIMIRGNVKHYVGEQLKITLQVWWCVPVACGQV